jgi:hypothetical protein
MFPSERKARAYVCPVGANDNCVTPGYEEQSSNERWLGVPMTKIYRGVHNQTMVIIPCKRAKFLIIFDPKSF